MPIIQLQSFFIFCLQCLALMPSASCHLLLRENKFASGFSTTGVNV